MEGGTPTGAASHAGHAALVPHVALLRAVNVGGRNRVPMADLKAMAMDVGLVTPRTFLQSGNLVFGAPGGEGETAGEALRVAIETRLGVATPVIVRTQAELHAAIAANPFPDAARAQPAALLTVFLQRPADPAGVAIIRERTQGAEAIEAIGREAFIHYAQGVLASKLTSALLDRRLGSAGTARNWNTVLALAELMAQVGAGF
jgi:uncharacterized protein (DUF1697 family)